MACILIQLLPIVSYFSALIVCLFKATEITIKEENDYGFFLPILSLG